MNLGIEGKWALVCAASKGLGKGCAAALVKEGVNVVITARGAEALEATAAELRAFGGGQVKTVAGDITTSDGRDAALAACPQVDILVNNAGGPPPGDFRQWDRDAWIKAIDANMLTPIELMKATVDRMGERGFGRVVNITSGAVKAPIDVLGLSNGARSGLTGFVAGLARSNIAAKGVDDQRAAAGRFRHRSPADDARRLGETGQRVDRIDRHRAPAHDPGEALRPRRRVRRCLRFPLQRACRLSHRTERADRRRRLPRHVSERSPVRRACHEAGSMRRDPRQATGMSAPQFQH